MARSSRSADTATIDAPGTDPAPDASVVTPEGTQAAAAAPSKALARTAPASDRAMAALKPPPGPGSPSLPTVALRGQKIQLLMGQMLARSMANQTATATVLPWRFDTDTWNDIVAMQTAVAERLQQQQSDWVQGLTEIMQGYAQLRLANTLSKFAEQEYNLGAQIGALMNDQFSQFVELMENVQVDYGYWITQKRAAALGD